jgi:hypothetical protein
MAGILDEPVPQKPPGPPPGSLWVFRTSDNSHHITFVKVVEWSTGRVEVDFYSLNGTSSSIGPQELEIPIELCEMSVEQFWAFVKSRCLVLLEPAPGKMLEDQPLRGPVMEGVRG